MYVLTNKRFKNFKQDFYFTYRLGFSFCRLGHAPGVGLGGAEGGQKFDYSEHGHVAYQIEGGSIRYK